MKIKNFSRTLSLLLWLLLFIGVIASAAVPRTQQTTETFEPFIRMDRDSVGAWEKELDNVRFIKKGLYKLKKTNAKYEINDIIPREDGLESLCISGSAQFSLPQFCKLAEELRNTADGKEIYIIDLRRESHVLLGAIPVSWYESHNWGNLGLALDEIYDDELKRFVPLIGKTVKLYAREDDSKVDETAFYVRGFLTEKELVESLGFHYYRIPIQDHTWPKPEQIDEFVEFVKGIDMNKTWLHFHCQAGKGRTGLFMTIYDKMKNPKVPAIDVIVRQAKLGGSYPLYTEDSDNYKVPYYSEKAILMPLFCQYVEENYMSNYEISWSEWLVAARF